MNRLRFHWAACVVIIGRCLAQNNLSLQGAIQEALRVQPQLAIADARVEQAGGQKVQAGLRRNPRITLQSEDLRPSSAGLPFSFANSTEDYFLIAQVIETGGKRNRRLDVANSNINAAELQRELERRQVAARVCFSYWSAVSTRRIQELAEQNLRTYDEDATYIGNRVKEGVAAEADLIRIQIERDRASAQLQMAKRDADQAILDLYRQMGRSDFSPVTLTNSLEDITDIAPADIARILPLRAEIQIAQQAVQQANTETKLQRADGKPDPEAFVGYKRNVGFDTAYAAVQIDLPLRNRNQGNIASSIAAEHMASASLRAAELTVRAEVEAAQRAYLDQRTLIEQFPASVKRAQESEQLSRAAYREGALDLLRLLDAERSRIQLQSEYYRALMDFQQSIVKLQLATAAPLGGQP